jgi:hypothetical protein
MSTRPWLILALSAMLGACAAERPVVFVSRAYDSGKIRRVAMVDIVDFPGAPGSGEIMAGTFEKYLLRADYNLIERRQLRALLREKSLELSEAVGKTSIKKLGRLLGVDALAFGSLTDFSDVREQTVMVDMPLQHTEPIYGTVVTKQRNAETEVETRQKVVTGYSLHSHDRIIPQTETLPAHIGLSVRLVSVETGEVLWSASAASNGIDLAEASEEVSAGLMESLLKQLRPSGH